MALALWLYTDGASRGNPGPAAIGFLIKDQAGEVLAQHAECIGRATSNQAEYRALIAGLHAALPHGAAGLTWISDSELVVRQMQGKYRVKESRLKQLHEQAVHAITAFSPVVIEHRPRGDSQIAHVDRMVSKVLDECVSRDSILPSQGEGYRK